jgi:MOSC domain-containing protein YiiM
MKLRQSKQAVRTAAPSRPSGGSATNVLSTNVGHPKEVMWRGKPVLTGIYKTPVASIKIKKFFVEGDNVADLRVHGGESKAVYGYPSEHYEFWRSEFPAMEMHWGMFGENITTQGLFENEMMIGSVYRVGSALLQVTEPRMPCYKLGIKFGTVSIIKRFLKSRKSGFYFTVLEEGRVKPGDKITLEQPGEIGYSIQDVVKSYAADE